MYRSCHSLKISVPVTTPGDDPFKGITGYIDYTGLFYIQIMEGVKIIVGRGMI